MYVLNLTNIYDVCNSHNCQTVTLKNGKCNATISLPISIKHIIRGPNGDLIFIILGAQGGQKLGDYLEKSQNIPLRKLLRDDSVISVKLYSTSFFSIFSNYLQTKDLPTLRYILIESIFGKK